MSSILLSYTVICSRFRTNTHIAEELTQETFFKALKKVDDFRGDCDLRVWLCQISKNTYYDYLKKNKKYAPESQDEKERKLSLRSASEFFR